MDPEICKMRLAKNLTTIKETISVEIEPIIDRLIEKEIITWEMKDELESIKGSVKKADFVLNVVRNGGSDAYNTFLDVLTKKNFKKLVEQIMKTPVNNRRRVSTVSVDMRDAAGAAGGAEAGDISPPISATSEDIQKVRDEMNQNNQAVLSAIKEMSCDMKSKLEQIANHDREIEEMRKENESLRTQMQTLQNENNALVFEVNKTVKSGKDIVDKNKHLVSDNNIKTKCLSRLKKENADLRTRIAAIEEGNKRLIAHLRRRDNTK